MSQLGNQEYTNFINEAKIAMIQAAGRSFIIKSMFGTKYDEVNINGLTCVPMVITKETSPQQVIDTMKEIAKGESNIWAYKGVVTQMCNWTSYIDLVIFLQNNMNVFEKNNIKAEEVIKSAVVMNSIGLVVRIRTLGDALLAVSGKYNDPWNKIVINDGIETVILDKSDILSGPRSFDYAEVFRRMNDNRPEN